MTSTEQKPYKEFIIYRIEAALQRLKDNPAYMERCRQQDLSGEAVDELLHKLNDDERTIIRRHYEGETVRQNYELDAAYIQGMRDIIHILSFLDAFHTEVYFNE